MTTGLKAIDGNHYYRGWYFLSQYYLCNLVWLYKQVKCKAGSGGKTHLPTEEVMRLQRFLHIRIPLWGHFLSSTKVCEHFLHSTQVKFLHCAHKFRTWREETLNILLLCFVDWRKSIMLQDHNHIRIECKQMHMVCQSLFLLLLLVSEKKKNPVHKYLIFYFKITSFAAKHKEKLK
mgnify:CR=1 FL=1